MTLILLYIFAALLIAVAADAVRPYAPILAPVVVCPTCRRGGWRMAT